MSWIHRASLDDLPKGAPVGRQVEVCRNAPHDHHSVLDGALEDVEEDFKVWPMTVAPESNSGSYFSRQDRDSLRYEWMEVYNFPAIERAGRHAMKVGLNVSFNTYHGMNISNTVFVARADGTLSQRIDFINSGTGILPALHGLEARATARIERDKAGCR